MLSSAMTLVALVALAADPAPDLKQALRPILSEGWEIGAFGKAWPQVEALGEARGQEPVVVAVALLQMRHNLFPEARKSLQGLSENSTDPVALTALAWNEASAGEHGKALATLERAARLVEKKSTLESDVVMTACGNYFGFLECHPIDPGGRSAYQVSRRKILAFSSQEQRDLIDELQTEIELRLGKLSSEGVELSDPVAIEAEKTKTLADLDRRLAQLTTEYQKQAKLSVTLGEQVKALQAQRNPAVTSRIARQQEAIAKATSAMEKARDLAQSRKGVARRFDEMLDKARLGAPTTPNANEQASPQEVLNRAVAFPFDRARQVVLRSLVSSDDAKLATRENRIWTNRTGTMMFVAQLVRVDLDRVVLRNPGGKEASLEIAKLSHPDQRFVDIINAPLPTDLAEHDPAAPTDSPTAGTGTSVDLPYQLKIISATWGAGDSKADVTQKVRELLAKDPYLPLQGDDRAFGDPAQGQKKTLELSFEVDGKPGSLSIPQDSFSTVPAISPEGRDLPKASPEFRLIAVRYGAGTTWEDVTHMFRPRIMHPGETLQWHGFSWGDPWYGVHKRLVVWFDYQGKRRTKNIEIGSTQPLIEGLTVPDNDKKFTAAFKHDYWRHDSKGSATLRSNRTAFGVTTEITGNFLGGGEGVELSLDAKENWQVGGHTAQPLAIRGTTVTTALRNKFEHKVEHFGWSAGKEPVKMLHSSEGFCVLSGVGGFFGGAGEHVYVTINPKDGFWYLQGTAANNSVWTKAIAYRLKPKADIKLRYMEFLSPGGMKILDKDEGFCYLSGMMGSFRGFGEHATVKQNELGDWELHGQGCGARAIAVVFE